MSSANVLCGLFGFAVGVLFMFLMDRWNCDPTDLNIEREYRDAFGSGTITRIPTQASEGADA